MINNLFNNELFLIIFLLTYILLIAVICIIYIKMKKLDKEYNDFIKKLGRGEDITTALKQYINQVENVNYENMEIKAYCKKINDDIDNCIQKIGIIRYNAFNDVGSNLSFALAVLDKTNSGIVLNGIYGRDCSNIYAKPIKNGESTYKLSDEEKNAIDIAINKKNFD